MWANHGARTKGAATFPMMKAPYLGVLIAGVWTGTL